MALAKFGELPWLRRGRTTSSTRRGESADGAASLLLEPLKLRGRACCNGLLMSIDILSIAYTSNAPQRDVGKEMQGVHRGV